MKLEEILPHGSSEMLFNFEYDLNVNELKQKEYQRLKFDTVLNLKLINNKKSPSEIWDD